MSSDWDEIKRLAADFQKAQLTSTLQKLSERNCVEIVALLLEKKLLEVVFTNDGKEYVTLQQLERELLDQMAFDGGRVNLVEMSKTLNVDLSKIEEIAKKITAEQPNINYILGQLISDDYIATIAEEINEKLAQKGEISVSDLTEQYDLPSDFLQHNVCEKHLGKIIRGRQDANNPHIFFTQAYIQRCKAKLRGALSAITRPTNISVILQLTGVPEKVFHSLFDEIGAEGLLTSKAANAQYVPHRYAKMQNEWVSSFYKQNGFVEYNSINKLGITDAKQFLKRLLPNEEILFLKRCAISAKTVDLNVVSSLSECHASQTFLDLATILPSSMFEEDIEEVFNAAMARKDSNPQNFVFLDTVVFSQQYLAKLIKPCEQLALNNSKQSVESGAYQHYLAEKQLSNKFAGGEGGAAHDFEDEKQNRREERRKKASSGKTGGGTTGRETKTKSTKKHQRGGRGAVANADSDEETQMRCGRAVGGANKNATKTLQLLSAEDIAKTISKELEDEGLEHLADKIAQLHVNQLNLTALANAQELFEAIPQMLRRETHAAIQEKLNTLLGDIRLYEKGIKLFTPDVQLQLVKYLLKSLGNDICNELTLYIANENNLNVKSTNLNVDQRLKIAQQCAPEYRAALLELNKSLSKSIDDFVNATEVVLKSCSMIVKKVDKKKDRALIIQHKDKLLEQLHQTKDSALYLHLVTLILFTTISGCILYASGKFVSNILAFIRPHLSAEQNKLLMQYHDLVLMLLQADADTDAAKNISESLQTLQTDIKQLTTSFERPGVTKAD